MKVWSVGFTQALTGMYVPSLLYKDCEDAIAAAIIRVSMDWEKFYEYDEVWEQVYSFTDSPQLVVSRVNRLAGESFSMIVRPMEVIECDAESVGMRQGS